MVLFLSGLKDVASPLQYLGKVKWTVLSSHKLLFLTRENMIF